MQKPAPTTQLTCAWPVWPHVGTVPHQPPGLLTPHPGQAAHTESALMYHVWVGTYDAGEYARYQLRLLDGPATLASEETEGPEPEPTPDCRQAMIRAGFPSSVGLCAAAEPYCAAAAIRAGQPSSVSLCQGVVSECAVAMIEAGYASSIARCRGVDAACAVQMIRSGYSSRVTQCC